MLNLEEAKKELKKHIEKEPISYAENDDVYVFCMGDPMYLESISKQNGSYENIALGGLVLLMANPFGDCTESEIKEAEEKHAMYIKLVNKLQPV